MRMLQKNLLKGLFVVFQQYPFDFQDQPDRWFRPAQISMIDFQFHFQGEPAHTQTQNY